MIFLFVSSCSMRSISNIPLGHLGRSSMHISFVPFFYMIPDPRCPTGIFLNLVHDGSIELQYTYTDTTSWNEGLFVSF